MITDYDNKSAELEWEKPLTDGGRSITHYSIEIKDKFSPDWQEIGKTISPDPKFTVDGLKERQTYEFRVKAHNKAGAGIASDSSDIHLCKYKNCKINNHNFSLSSYKILLY